MGEFEDVLTTRIGSVNATVPSYKLSIFLPARCRRCEPPSPTFVVVEDRQLAVASAGIAAQRGPAALLVGCLAVWLCLSLHPNLYGLSVAASRDG
jgi:hypothetical protein